MFAHGKPETVQLEFTRKGRESQISGLVGYFNIRIHHEKYLVKADLKRTAHTHIVWKSTPRA